MENITTFNGNSLRRPLQPADVARLAGDLARCVANDQLVRAKLLLKNLSTEDRQAVVTTKLADGYAPLFLAAQLGKVQFVHLLLDEGHADIEQRGTYEVAEDRSRHQVSPLWCAAVTNRLEVVRALTRHGADVNAASDTQSTPVRSACYMTNTDVVRYLVDTAGADIHRPNMNGGTCLINAVQSVELCRFLISRNASVNAHDNSGNLALHYAIREGRVETVMLLMESGSDAFARNDSGDDAIQSAALRGHREILEYLLRETRPGRAREIEAWELMGTNSVDEKHDVPAAVGYWKTAMELRCSVGDVGMESRLSNSEEDCGVEFGGGVEDLGVKLGGRGVGAEARNIRMEADSVEGLSEVVSRVGVSGYGRGSDAAVGVSEGVVVAGAGVSGYGIGSEAAAVSEGAVAAGASGSKMCIANMRNWITDANLAVVELPPNPAYRGAREPSTVAAVVEMGLNPDRVYMHALVLRERILGANHKDTIFGLMYRGAVYADTHDYQRCVDLWKYAFALRHARHRLLTHEYLFTLQALCKLFWEIFDEDDFSEPGKAGGNVKTDVGGTNAVRFIDAYEVLEMTVAEVASAKAALVTAEDWAEWQDELLVMLQLTLHLVQLLVRLGGKGAAEAHALNRLLHRLVRVDVRLVDGRGLLRLAADRRTASVSGEYYSPFPSSRVVSALLDCGADACAVDAVRDTTLHAVTRELVAASGVGGADRGELAAIALSLVAAGAHVDAVNLAGAMAARGLGQVVPAFDWAEHVTLKCRAARVVRAEGIEYRGIVPESLNDFIEVH